MDRSDPAIVNLPLSKRGDLAAMARQSVEEEGRAWEARFAARRQASRAAFAQAKALIGRVSDDRMAQMGAAHGLTAKQTRAQFVSAARSNPGVVIRLMTLELERS